MKYSKPVGPSRQSGVVLVVGLLMLAVVTMLALSSIALTDGSLAIVSNTQTERRTMAVADRVVEDTLSELDNFTNPAAVKIESAGVNATRSDPQCIASDPVAGFSLNSQIALQHNYYEFEVTAKDSSDGGNNRIKTGVRILLNADTCG